MTATEQRARPRLGRAALPFLVDAVVAAVAALLVFRLFGAVSGVDTNPPQCYNAAGGVVSCALSAPVLMPPTFAVTFLALVVWRARRRSR